jgi:septal ring factor EnvC (AmiA/AmiB activator)
VSGARGELDKLRRERAVHTAKRRRARAAPRREADLGERRAALAGQIRAAHMIGQEEPLKLLLNQRDPAQTGRVLTYYQYFGRARAAQIAAINRTSRARDARRALAEKERARGARRTAQAASCSKLQSARERRGRALVRSMRIEEPREGARAAQGSAGRPRKAGARAARALERIDKFPTDSKDAFAKLRGKLAWPSPGKLLASFGQTAPAA